MSLKTPFEQQLLQGVEFVLPGPVSPPQTIPICKTAELFASVCETLLEETSANPTDIAVNLALLSLQEKFFACYALAPASCRRHMHSDKIICLFQTYRQTYLKLFEVRLKLTPPRLREEPPPPDQITQFYQYDGFAIGERVVEDNEDEE